MKLITNWFDYIYYRSSVFYNEGHLTPTLMVTLIKTLCLIDIYALILHSLKSQKLIDSNSSGIEGIATALFVLNLIVDYRNYNGKFETFNRRWQSESKSERSLNGFLVLATFIAPFLPFIIRLLINVNNGTA